MAGSSAFSGRPRRIFICGCDTTSTALPGPRSTRPCRPRPSSDYRSPSHRPLTKSPSKTVPITGHSDSRSRSYGSFSSRSDSETIARSADLPGLMLPVVVSAQGPGAEKSRHGQQELPGERFIAAVQETNLVEDAQAVGGGEAVGSEAHDRAPFEQCTIRVRCMPEPGMRPGKKRWPRDGPRARPRAEVARSRRARGRSRGRSASRRCAIRLSARSRPGAARSAPTRRPRRPALRETRAAVRRGVATTAAPRASRPGASRAASGWRPPCGKASPRCCRERAGSGPAAHRRPPEFSGRIEPSHLQAISLVSSPRSRFRPISSAKTTARNGAAATDPRKGPPS